MRGLDPRIQKAAQNLRNFWIAGPSPAMREIQTRRAQLFFGFAPNARLIQEALSSLGGLPPVCTSA
jgi:hypothetical protein